MSGHSYGPPRFLFYSQVEVGSVIQFGPQASWAIVTRILPDSPTHWELVWAFGRQKGCSEIVTPSSRAVYRARNAEDAAYEHDRVRRFLGR